MALKRKGSAAKDISGRKAAVPKAGPKARRAKSEAEAIRAAVEEHGKRGRPKPSRRAGKVNTFQYKEPPAKEPEPEPMWSPYLREPHELEAFRRELPPEQQSLAANLFKMDCPHEVREVTASITPLDPSAREEWWKCPRCWYSAKKQGKLSELRAEWNSYCPEGYDMWEWADMFTKDKTLWRFIYDEAEHMLVADVLGSKEAA